MALLSVPNRPGNARHANIALGQTAIGNPRQLQPRAQGRSRNRGQFRSSDADVNAFADKKITPPHVTSA